MARSSQPVVRVPESSSDRPLWTRVGLLALGGFVIGVLWPRLAGVTLGPEPPLEELAKAIPSGSIDSDPGIEAPIPVVSASAAAPQEIRVQTVIVKRTDTLSCRNDKNAVQDDCDRPEFDSLLMPKIKDLAKCPAAAGLAGTLSVGFNIDFHRNTISLLQGKSTTIPTTTQASIWTCANKEIRSLKIDALQHVHTRYTVFYTAHFYPPGKVLDPGMKDDLPGKDLRDVPESEQATETSKAEETLGTAQIVYDTALVRDQPKDGKIVGRLVRGTRVEMIKKDGSWYQIRFQDKEGWVYRGAIAE